MDYPRKSIGHVIQALRDWGFCEPVTGEVRIGDFMITLHGQPFAAYQYFDGIEQPLFRFASGAQRHPWVHIGEGVHRPNFRLTLGSHDLPSLEVSGVDACPSLHRYISSTMLTSWMDQPGYALKNASGAFFQGGSHDETGERIFIEFWKPAGAQAWVDFLNNTFTRKI